MKNDKTIELSTQEIYELLDIAEYEDDLCMDNLNNAPKVFVNKEELLDNVFNKVILEFESILDVSNRVPFSEVVIYKKSLSIFKKVIEEVKNEVFKDKL